MSEEFSVVTCDVGDIATTAACLRQLHGSAPLSYMLSLNATQLQQDLLSSFSSTVNLRGHFHVPGDIFSEQQQLNSGRHLQLDFTVQMVRMLGWRSLTVVSVEDHGDLTRAVLADKLRSGGVEVSGPVDVRWFRDERAMLVDNWLPLGGQHDIAVILREAKKQRLINPETRWLMLDVEPDLTFDAGDNVLIVWQKELKNSTACLTSRNVMTDILKHLSDTEHSAVSYPMSFISLAATVQLRATLTVNSTHSNFVEVTINDEGETFENRIFPNTKYGWSMKPLDILAIPYASWLYADPRGKFGHSGKLMDILDYCSHSENFTARFTLRDVYGGLENGTQNYSGVIGEIQHRHGDIGLSAFSVTLPRKNAVDFSETIHYTKIYMSGVVGLDSDLTGTIFAFIKPFSWQVWLFILSLLPVVALVILSTVKYSPQGAARRGPHLDSWRRCFWHSVSTLLGQGSIYTVERVSTMWVVGSWWIHYVVLANCYVGLLIASLTVPPRNSHPIRTLEDAVASGQSVSVWRHTSTEDMLREMNSTTQVLYQRLVERQTYHSTLEDYFHDVVTNRYIGIGTDEMILMASQLYDVGRVACEMKPLGLHFSANTYAFILVKNSKYADKIKKCIMKLDSAGLSESFRRRHDFRNTKIDCSEVVFGGAAGGEEAQSDVRSPSLSLTAALGLFALWAAGMVASFLLLLAERLVFHRDCHTTCQVPQKLQTKSSCHIIPT